MVKFINNLGTRLTTRVTVLYYIQPRASGKITQRLIPIFFQSRHYQELLKIILRKNPYISASYYQMNRNLYYNEYYTYYGSYELTNLSVRD
jgi:hypothetical protein